jgi:hypothetical protein
VPPVKSYPAAVDNLRRIGDVIRGVGAYLAKIALLAAVYVAGVLLLGAGLGLPLSRSLAEAMGGTLELASTNGQGSVFWLELRKVDDPGTWRNAAPDATPAARGG